MVANFTALFNRKGSTPVKKEIKVEVDSKEFQSKMEEMKRLRGSDQVHSYTLQSS